MLGGSSARRVGGELGARPGSSTAFSHRGTQYEFVAAARWCDPTEDQPRLAAARRYATALEPFASGAYVNALTEEGQAGVRRAYPPEKLARLTTLEHNWDPDNTFHLNHNIRPTSHPAGPSAAS